MRDINFFSNYQGKNKNKQDTTRYIYGSIGIVGFLIILTLGINSFRIFSLNRSIKQYNEKINKPEIQEKLTEAERINKEIEILTQYDSVLNNVSSSIKTRDNVSDKVLNDISSTIPSSVSFKNLEINNDILILQGISKDREAVGELQHNLKGLAIVYDVFLNALDSASSVEGEYSFDIKCVLRSVD